MRNARGEPTNIDEYCGFISKFVVQKAQQILTNFERLNKVILDGCLQHFQPDASCVIGIVNRHFGYAEQPQN